MLTPRQTNTPCAPFGLCVRATSNADGTATITDNNKMAAIRRRALRRWPIDEQPAGDRERQRVRLREREQVLRERFALEVP